MKSVALAAALLIFNIMMSGVVSSGIFETNIHFESEMIDRYGDITPSINESTSDEQRGQASSNILNVIYDTLSWSWVNQFIPADLREDAAWWVSGLNILSVFIISVGIIELFWRRNILT